LMSIKLNSLADIQHELLAPVQWAMNSTYHTTLQATSAQLAFHCDMIMPTSYMVHWQPIHPPKTSSHHQLRQPPRKCTPSPSHVFSGRLSPYPSRHSR
jgi:hypothetical protein